MSKNMGTELNELTNMMKQPKIAILIASLGGGGAERIVADTVRGLAARGQDVSLILLDKTITLDLPDGITYYVLSNLSNESENWKKMAAAPLIWFRLLRLARKKRFDLIISHLGRANIINLLGFGWKKICTNHNFISGQLPYKDPFKAFWIDTFYRLMARFAHAFPCVSKASALDLVSSFRIPSKKVHVLYNFLDVSKVSALSRQKLPHETIAGFDSPVVITAGRLSLDKGHWHLIRAFKAVHDGLPHARLIILGQGPLESRLRSLVSDLDLEERVDFPGFQTNPFAWMSRASCFVLTSLFEGFPMILLEALACQVPILSSDCLSGPREIFAPRSDPFALTTTLDLAEFGMLFPAPDGIWRDASEPLTVSENALAQGMIRLLTNPDLNQRYARQAWKRAYDFDLDAGVSKWDALIRQVLQQAPQASSGTWDVFG